MAEEFPQEFATALQQLRDYVRKFHPELDESRFPVEFWRNGDDDLYWETLLYFPLFFGTVSSRVWDVVPKGFRIAYPIFWLEDDYMVNGWTALTNAGESLLGDAAWAYREIGLPTEADALGAALNSIHQSPSDENAAKAAYRRVEAGPDHDDIREQALIRYFTANRNIFEG